MPAAIGFAATVSFFTLLISEDESQVVHGIQRINPTGISAGGRAFKRTGVSLQIALGIHREIHDSLLIVQSVRYAAAPNHPPAYPIAHYRCFILNWRTEIDVARMNGILFWGCLLALLPQAIYVRKTAPRFSPAAGPPSGSAGTGKPLHLMAIGDSIIAGVGASQLTDALVGQTAENLARSLACQVKWTALGENGIDSRGVVDRLVPRLPDKETDIFLVSAGVNDITGLSTLSGWQRNLAQVLESLTRHSPQAVIAVAGIPPLRGFPVLPQPLRALIGSRGEAFDGIARELISQHPNALHLPLDFDPTPDQFSADGFHPSEASYSKFGEMMALRIAERLTKMVFLPKSWSKAQ